MDQKVKQVMAETRELESYEQVLASKDLLKAFIVANGGDKVKGQQDYAMECNFAKIMIESSPIPKKGKSLKEVCNENTLEFLTAMKLCALSPLSLDPSLKLAYLYNSYGKVVFQPSYQGLSELMQMSGAINAIKTSDVVYSGEPYEVVMGDIQGHVQKNRDNKSYDDIEHAYLIVYLVDGLEVQVNMPKKELDKRKDLSKSGMWDSWDQEMIYKTLIKKLWKQRPKKNKHYVSTHLLDQQVKMEQEALSKIPTSNAMPEVQKSEVSEDQFNQIMNEQPSEDLPI